MGLALEEACQKLGLANRADQATELVAKKIIEAAQRGERDPNQLARTALQFFQN